MSASHDSHAEESHEIHPHPPMPAVHDEAADSPAWLPMSGLAIVILMVLYVLFRSAMTPPEPEPVLDEAAPAVAAEGAEAPAPSAE